MAFSLDQAKLMFSALPNAGITLAAAVAALLFVGVRRSRYFGNFAALLVAAVLLVIETTGVQSEPWLWAMPFLLAFTSGVLADALETRQRRIFLVTVGAILTMQTVLCWLSLPALV